MVKKSKTKPKSGKKSRRSKVKHNALVPKYNSKVRQEYMDAHSYINGVKDKEGNTLIRELTDDEKDWLNQFYKEYYNANLKRDGTDLHDTTDPKVRKEIYKANNVRNADLYGDARKKRILLNFDKDEYDRFVSEKVKGLDFEHLIIRNIEDEEE